MKPTQPPLLKVEDFAFLYVQCSPGLGKNNSRYADKGSKRLSGEYKTYRQHVWLAWLEAGKPAFHRGAVGMEIVAYWPTESQQLDIETAFADVDAIDKATLDALQPSKQIPGMRCLDTDMRVEPLLLRKKIDKKNPHVEILLWNSTHDQR